MKIYLTEEQFGTIIVEQTFKTHLNNLNMLNGGMTKNVKEQIRNAILAGASAAALLATINQTTNLDDKAKDELSDYVEMVQNKYANFDESSYLHIIPEGLKMMDFLMKHGATLEVAAGIAGNWHNESRFEADPTGYRDGGHAWGLAQWSDRHAAGERAQKLLNFYGLKNLKDINSLDVYKQAEFAINGENLLSYFTGNETPEEAASRMCAHYERPKYGKPGQKENIERQNLARDYYEYYKYMNNI